jgi:hypothetical protein
MVGLALTVTLACGSNAPTTPSPVPTPGPAPAPTPAPAPAEVSLKGVVTAQSGSKLLDATVTILDGPNALRFTKTSLSGEYLFNGLVPGNANVSVVKTGYEERRGGLFIDGTNTFDVVLRTAVPWNTRGGANATFDMPAYVTRVRVRATWRGTGPSNFSVSVSGVTIVSVVLGDLPNGTYEGEHAVSGTRVHVESNSNVAISWWLTEVRD